MALNKVNLCWVISDGRKGHEIQSTTLANNISKNVQTHRFNLIQPWESFAPRIIPGFKHGIIWHGERQPMYSETPNVIIAAGRKAAAVAKHICQKIKQLNQEVTHIQILNPKDSFKNYDLVLIPIHDNQKADNVIPFLGSIHPFNSSWFNQTDAGNSSHVALIIGNPASAYFKKEFSIELSKIRTHYSDKTILICGSPRLKSKQVAVIKKQLIATDNYWFDHSDGDNPYQKTLQTAAHIFVTSDSINMMNECAASHAFVTLLATQFVPSKKHQRYIDSIENRWSDFNSNPRSFEKVDYSIEQIINDTTFQKLLNSPTSSNSG